MIVSDDYGGSHAMESEACQKPDIDATACHVSCIQSPVTDHLHFVIQKDGHKLLLQMDKAFIPK